VHIVAPEADNEAVAVGDFDASLCPGPTFIFDPLAARPERFPHLAALRHLEAVQGVAMRTEETSHEVVTPAVFATRLVKLLPPILVVASVFVDRDDLPSVAFAWLGAGGLRKVVQSISCALPVGGEASQQISVLARGPAPLVKCERPV